jgi:two-component system response regulator PilR (NtrC family)
VDDEPGFRDVLSILFRREGYAVTATSGLATARTCLDDALRPYSVVVTDLSMPDGSGLDVLQEAKARSAGTEVILVTGHGTVQAAIDAMRRGAYDFLTKPVNTTELLALVQKAVEKSALVLENAALRAQITKTQAADDGLGPSLAMRKVAELVKKVGPSKTTVLVTGESGTGKERVARALHDASERRDKPFVVVNCGAIPEGLMESELFGHEKGAYTGAATRSLGLIRQADGGTLVLDEVGELPLGLQVKLLRVLQERKVRGVGEANESSVDVRVIAATNRNLEEAVRSNTFRQDLYYRLNVIRLELLPLRERPEDILEFAQTFLELWASDQGKQLRGFSPDALRALASYTYPGNVRELQNIVERAVTLSSGPVIGLGDLPSQLSGSASLPTSDLLCLPEDGCDIDALLGEAERRLLLQALDRSGGTRTAAAKLLGLSLRSFRYRLQKHAMDLEGDGEIADIGGDGRDSSGALPAKRQKFSP